MQSQRLSFGIGSLLVANAIGGCVSFTTAQTARTLKKGETAGHIGLMYAKQEGENKDDKTTDKQSSYGMSAGVRHGVTGNFDIGARGASMTFAMVDAKMSLVAKRDFAAAVGLGLGLSGFDYESESKSSAGTTSTTKSDGSQRVTDVPFYLSMEPAAKVALYSAFRYVYVHSENKRLSFGAGGGERESSSGRMLGLTLGAMRKGDLGFFGELSYAMSPDKDTKSTGLQLAAGLAFNEP